MSSSRAPGQAGPGRARPLARIAQDPGAFAAFYREHVAAVTRFVARRVADPHTVADLTAEVFLAVIDSAGSYRANRGTQLAWLYGIARNVIAGERRRAAHERRTASRIAGRRLLDEDDIARLEERIDAERPGRAAYEALAGLPADERAVLELVAIDGLAVKDAAAALGIRHGTARVRLHRARGAARQAMRPSAVPDTSPAGLESMT
ncbi:MAG: RNA polymerase sigma factor [Actinobacteria bacterium]|nr:RNA polymerase sigma factor [Actinomycetota bacterium]